MGRNGEGLGREEEVTDEEEEEEGVERVGTGQDGAEQRSSKKLRGHDCLEGNLKLLNSLASIICLSLFVVFSCIFSLFFSLFLFPFLFS